MTIQPPPIPRALLWNSGESQAKDFEHINCKAIVGLMYNRNWQQCSLAHTPCIDLQLRVCSMAEEFLTLSLFLSSQMLSECLEGFLFIPSSFHQMLFLQLSLLFLLRFGKFPSRRQWIWAAVIVDSLQAIVSYFNLHQTSKLQIWVQKALCQAKLLGTGD